MINERLKPYTARDMAGFCGVSLDQFYRTRARLEKMGMPEPYKATGKCAWSRETVDAWRRGTLPPRANNDVMPKTPTSDAEYRAILQAAYGVTT